MTPFQKENFKPILKNAWSNIKVILLKYFIDILRNFETYCDPAKHSHQRLGLNFPYVYVENLRNFRSKPKQFGTNIPWVTLC